MSAGTMKYYDNISVPFADLPQCMCFVGSVRFALFVNDICQAFVPEKFMNSDFMN